VELALRPLGCPLIPWEQLTAIRDALRVRGVAFHGDCARIWESQPFYRRSLADIAGCFDSVYVSLYKALGGLAGAVLAGPQWLIDAMRPWQSRMGQKLHRSFPYVLAALQGLEERLPLMPAFHRRAVEMAEAACRCAGVRVSPDPPHTNAFLLTIEGDAERAERAREVVAEQLGLWLYDYAVPSGDVSSVTVEVHRWTAGLQLSEEELLTGLRLFQHVLHS
jgi:threonine aldolase